MKISGYKNHPADKLYVSSVGNMQICKSLAQSIGELFHLSLMLILLFSHSELHSQTIAWEMVNPKPGGMTLSCMHFVDTQTGFAGSLNGAVVKTNDGGTTWKCLRTAWRYPINSIFFVNTQLGYAAGYNGIIKTMNGGETWNTIYYNENAYWNSICFTDANTGYVCASTGLLLKTTDGGLSWQTLYTGTAKNLNTIYFSSPNTGYVCGDNGIFLRTFNAGQTWVSKALNSSASLREMRFFNDSCGYLLSGGSQIGHTSNYGNTWNWITPQSNIPVDIAGIYFATPQNGIVVVDDNYRLYKTLNGGLTLNVGNTQEKFNTDFSDVIMTSPTTAYLCSDNGLILKTTNGGTSWVKMSSNFSQFSFASFEKISIASSTTAFITNSYEIFKTTDAGLSWNQLPMPNDQFREIAFSNESVGYAASDNALYKTINGGHTWQPILSNFSDFWPSLFVADMHNVWLKTQGHGLMKTADGGANWVNLNATDEIYRPSFINLTTGLAIVDKGSIYKTTDGGQSWVIVYQDSSKIFTKIFFCSQTPGGNFSAWVSGHDGALIRTNDSGNSWTSINTGTTTIINSLWLTDCMHAYLTLYLDNRILYTADGGLSWKEEIVNGVGYALTDIGFFTPTSAIAGGRESGIVKLTINPPVGISEPLLTSNNEVRVYPNPASHNLTIAGFTEGSRVCIHDIQGRIVYSDTPENQNIDISALPSGLYIVRIYDHTQISHSRFLKE